ncbi:MAG: hypothetical protein WKG32_20605 [Gemmatimonadaceae bacterium]
MISPLVRTPGGMLAVVVLSLSLVRAYPLAAQQPTLPQQASALAPYRAPALALVQPAAGSAVTADKPVVVFRFAQGELTDPLDAASFAVTVDGVDRTALFQVAASETWGPLVPPPPGDAAGPLAPGLHQVSARICSSRGACGTVTTPVTVLPAPAAAAAPSGPQSASPVSKKKRLLHALVAAGKTLITP